MTEIPVHIVRLELLLLTVLAVSLTLLGCGKKKPMAVEEGMKNINGIDLYYESIGAGTPLLILHGGPGLDHSYLLPQMSKLAEDCKLIFYDQRGSGASRGPVDSTSITIDNFIADIEGMRQGLNLGKLNLFGHSWGATLAMLYTLKYPTHVQSLILADPGGASAEYQRQGIGIQKGRLTEGDRIAIATLVRTDEFKNRTPAVMEEYFRILFRATFYNKRLADSLTLNFSQETARNSMVIPQLLFRGMENFDLHEKLSAISCPTLIIHGKADTVPVEAAQRIHECIRGSKLVILQKSGHFPYIESPDEFVKTITDFLHASAGS